MPRATEERGDIDRAPAAVWSRSRASLARIDFRAWMLSRGVVEPLTVWALTRGVILLLTYFGVILFGSALHDPQHPSFLHALLPAWNHPKSHGGWDTQWYIDIARRGYTWKKSAGTSPVAFFPLYPLCVRLGTVLTHRSYLGVALALSNLFLLLALGYMWRLAKWELDEAVARRAILYISVFPTALFFFAGYSESLFLLLSVACFYHLRRHDWLVAGLCGALASATRVTGILLLLPLIYEYARAANFSWRRAWQPGLLGICLLPSGLLLFMLYLQATVGDALAFSHFQSSWQKIFTPQLWAGTVETLRQILVVQPAASFFEAHNLINLTALLAFLLTTVLTARILPLPYALYMLAFWIVTLSSPAIANGYPVPLISMSRYVATLFPAFMVWGVLGKRTALHDAYLVTASALLSVLTVQFVNGGWII